MNVDPAVRRLSLSAGLGSLLMAATASASTYVVDANGGAGVDFTDIPPAIAAASAGDVIVVHPGDYSGFTLNVGLAIVGEPGVHTLDVQVSGLAPGARAAITSVQFRKLSISNCSAPVLLNHLTKLAAQTASGPVIDISTCSDVRLHGVQVPGAYLNAQDALRASNSRVEITNSSLTGSHGLGSFYNGGPGGAGVACENGSDVHISLSTVQGGAGGNSTSGLEPFGHAGDGGLGIHVAPAAKLLVTGRTSDLVLGGAGGCGVDSQYDGHPANALNVESGGIARVSSVTFQGGLWTCNGGNVPAIIGAATIVSPIDPSLAVSGTFSPGQTLTFTIHGRPGDTVRLRLGRQAIVQTQPDVYENTLTNPLRIYDLGSLPASGDAQKLITIPGSLPKGYLMVFQGTALGSDGITRFTQSVPVIVR